MTKYSLKMLKIVINYLYILFTKFQYSEDNRIFTKRKIDKQIVLYSYNEVFKNKKKEMSFYQTWEHIWLKKYYI